MIDVGYRKSPAAMESDSTPAGMQLDKARIYGVVKAARPDYK